MHSFQGSALERTAFEAPPRLSQAFTTDEAGASGALCPQAEPGTSATNVFTKEPVKRLVLAAL